MGSWAAGTSLFNCPHEGLKQRLCVCALGAWRVDGQGWKGVWGEGHTELGSRHSLAQLHSSPHGGLKQLLMGGVVYGAMKQ